MLVYSNLVEHMLAQFPSLYSAYETDYEEEERSLVHIILGQLFKPYIVEIYCKTQNCEEEKRRIADFLEAMATSPDEKVRGVLTDTVLEELMDDPPQFALISRYFQKKTGEIARDVQRGYQMFWG